MKSLKIKNVLLVVVIFTVAPALTVCERGSEVPKQDARSPANWPFPKPKVDPVADSTSARGGADFDEPAQPKGDPVPNWKAKFRGSSHVDMLEPLQAELDKAKAHREIITPALLALISEVAEGRDAGLTRAETTQYWENYIRRRDVVFAERDIRAAAIDAVACERKKVVFGAIEYCVTAYNVTKSDCAAALGMGIIELVIMKNSSCPN